VIEEDRPAEPAPGDSTERRDWDLPPAATADDGEQREDAGTRGRYERPPEHLDAPGDPRDAPADESERRDWDLP
jgi:hypothetical protein